MTPQIHNKNIYDQSFCILKALYGTEAKFRKGQYEAIEATLTYRRTLVVQRTGWGKSLVYFISTKILREQDRGVTMVVSPLLVLMQNQLEAAQKLGLRCDVLNSTVKDRRESIIDSLKKDELDLIFVTPETLFKDDMQDALPHIRIGLFVVDEAHCISDWGFDFRLDYSNLRTVIARLPQNVPLLATTATANDRVVDDLKKQFGEDVYISRGSLSRDSLYIQVLNLPEKAQRYAWILENLPKLPGSGIIYCLTRRDCDYLADFLCQNGILAKAYYSREGEEGEAVNSQFEDDFRNNRIKVIVATVKMGMGYDKGDISFIIHFQMPSNIVSYYQQIGRAGRNIECAYTFLMCGAEDKDVIMYFINTAFPTEEDTRKVIELIQNSNGIGLESIESRINIRRNRLEKVLTFLQHDGFIIKDRSKYFATVKTFVYNKEHYDQITKIRIREMKQMQELSQTDICYSRFTVNCLDDHSAENCGKCKNCTGTDLFSSEVGFESQNIASSYINGITIPIEPRKRWSNSNFEGVQNESRLEFVNQIGFSLAKYGDPGYGTLIKRDKYSGSSRFCDELVGAAKKALVDFVKQNKITHICPVPSRRSNIVSDFAERLASSLKLEFAELLYKTSDRQQKEMENSIHQRDNALNSFYVKEEAVLPENILLVDDVVDSRWTLTVCGYRLLKAGCKNIYPFTLANSSQREV